jgi:hypothetical protein
VHFALITFAAVVLQADTPCSCAACNGQVLPKRAQASVTTARFTIHSWSSAVDAAELSRHADAMHAALANTWLGKDESSDWSPRCEVVVHASRATYQRAVGSGAASTLGSTLIRYSGGKIAQRRIDLLADRPERPFETLSHELVHVIFAERFPNGLPPRWAEEGAALLADTSAKRSAHQRDFRHALSGGTAFSVDELIRMHDYPPPTRFAAFYGQSLVLVEFLTQLGEPGDFVRFVDRSLADGQETALREVYGIATMRHLESLWQEKAVKAVLASN